MNEIHSIAWPVVRAHIEKELDGLRNRLESTNLDLSATQVVRGEIRALKRLLDLPQTLEEARRQQTLPPAWSGGIDA